MDAPPRSNELADEVVIVFGAGSSGATVSNGEAAARAYALAGARVACIDVDSVEAARVAAIIAGEGGEALALRADVTCEDDVARAVADVVAAWGGPTVLHNNVGLATTGAVTDLDLAGWEGTIRVNLTSCYLTIRHVLPHFRGRRRGAIVNVSSLAALRDTGYVYPAYSAAKAAVNQLTVSVALTYAGEGIRANAVAPGLIDTPTVIRGLTDGPDLEAVREARHRRSPTGWMGSPWDVAHAAVFLASPRARYINGVCLPVDGGLAARCG